MAPLFCVKNNAMAAILNLWRHLKIGLRQSMRIYLKNNTAKFHPDPIFWGGRPKKEQEEEEQ